MNQVAVGRLKDAESALSAALADRASGSEQSCAWLTLHNLAIVMALSGRLAEAEVLEKRSLKVLENGYPPHDPFLLRPLQSLDADSVRTAEDRKGPGNVSKIAVDSYRPAGRSRHDSRSGGSLLYAEDRYHESEAEYLKALGAWEEAGLGETTDVSAILGGLAILYVADGRYREAGRTLDRALAIVASAKDAVPMDRIKLFRALSRTACSAG